MMRGVYYFNNYLSCKTCFLLLLLVLNILCSSLISCSKPRPPVLESDRIEEVDAAHLLKLYEEEDYLAVFFRKYNPPLHSYNCSSPSPLKCVRLEVFFETRLNLLHEIYFERTNRGERKKGAFEERLVSRLLFLHLFHLLSFHPSHSHSIFGFCRSLLWIIPWKHDLFDCFKYF